MTANLELSAQIRRPISVGDCPIGDIDGLHDLALAYAQEFEHGPHRTFQPPDNINMMSDDEVSDALLICSQIEGHYRAVEEKVKPTIKHLRERRIAFKKWLATALFGDVSAKEQDDCVVQSEEYLSASEALLALERVAAYAAGERGRWGDIYAGLSRAIEIRKGKVVPGRSPDGDGAKSPGRSPTTRVTRGPTKTPYKTPNNQR